MARGLVSLSSHGFLTIIFHVSVRLLLLLNWVPHSSKLASNFSLLLLSVDLRTGSAPYFPQNKVAFVFPRIEVSKLQNSAQQVPVGIHYMGLMISLARFRPELAMPRYGLSFYNICDKSGHCGRTPGAIVSNSNDESLSSTESTRAVRAQVVCGDPSSSFLRELFGLGENFTYLVPRVFLVPIRVTDLRLKVRDLTPVGNAQNFPPL